MDEKEKTAQPVPYVVFEGEMTRKERTERRLWVVIIILILALVGSNAGWIWYESQWETVETTEQTVTQEADRNGSNLFVGGDYRGTADHQDKDDQNP